MIRAVADADQLTYYATLNDDLEAVNAHAIGRERVRFKNDSTDGDEERRRSE
ncbi:MAG: hypothetical protein IJU71_07100 [Selenomonadaceae bacterium]|nr:hypothetical protein [Selenomonadaceae bacterium]